MIPPLVLPPRFQGMVVHGCHTELSSSWLAVVAAACYVVSVPSCLLKEETNSLNLSETPMALSKGNVVLTSPSSRWRFSPGVTTWWKMGSSGRNHRGVTWLCCLDQSPPDTSFLPSWFFSFFLFFLSFFSFFLSFFLSFFFHFLSSFLFSFFVFLIFSGEFLFFVIDFFLSSFLLSFHFFLVIFLSLNPSEKGKSRHGMEQGKMKKNKKSNKIKIK